MLKKLLLIFLISIFLCGCTKSFNGEEITFSSWGSVTEVEILKDVIADFEESNPNIKVKFIHIPQNYFQKIHLLFASNTAPDVLFINNIHIPLYESKLEDLSSYINKDDFYSQALDGMSYEGKILAVPRDVSNLVFYVNEDMLKDKKLNLPSENWRIEDLLEYSQRLSTDGVWGVSYESDIYWVTPYLSYFGGGILSDGGKYFIDSEKSKEAINFYKELKIKYKVAPEKSQVGSSTLAQMFLDEKIAFYLSGRWMYPKIAEKANFNWTIVNFPYGKTPQLSDSSGWAISRSSKHKEGAYKFLQYLSSKETISSFAQTGLIVPARKDCKENIEGVFLDVIEHSKKTPVSKDYKKLNDEINIKLNL